MYRCAREASERPGPCVKAGRAKGEAKPNDVHPGAPMGSYIAGVARLLAGGGREGGGR